MTRDWSNAPRIWTICGLISIPACNRLRRCCGDLNRRTSCAGPQQRTSIWDVCVNPEPDRQGVAAQVCKPDIKTRTIAIAFAFCGLRKTNRIFGTDSSGKGDSQLLTLIHEVTHFEDVFNSTDDWNHPRVAKDMLASGRFDIARVNADNLAGYILGIL